MTPADMAEAVRLARLVDDYATTGTRHTMPGGHVATIARALLAVVAERDAYRRAKEENDERFMNERNAAIARADAEANRAQHIGADLADWRQRAERAETELADLKMRISIDEEPDGNGLRRRIERLVEANRKLKERAERVETRVHREAAAHIRAMGAKVAG